MIVEPYLSRFMERHDRSGGPDACWPWTAGRDGGGYGMTSIAPKRKERTHRIALELDGRPVPPGMTVDHLCRNRACANPRHLDIVTRGENIRRGGPYRRKATCLRGHPTGPGDRNPRGNCKECRRIDGREAMRRKTGYYERH